MPGVFDPDAVMSQRDRKRIDDFILYAIAAADEAIEHSGWKAETDEQAERAGVFWALELAELIRPIMRLFFCGIAVRAACHHLLFPPCSSIYRLVKSLSAMD